MSEIKITVKLFGAFRKCGETICVVLNTGASVLDVKTSLAAKMGGDEAALVQDSALANDNEIISGESIFNEDTMLAILPPVCGG